jgi:hypothetical protein
MTKIGHYSCLLLAVTALSGCSTMSTNDAIVPLQAQTAQMIGLASSDELTVSNVQATQPNALGGQQLSYTATTERGRVFDCTALMTPGLLTAPPTVSAPSCTPVLVHN